MSRVKSDTVSFFPHFAKQGKTVFILKNRWGSDGYSFWFQLLEILCQSEGHYYDCRSDEAWEYLVAQIGVPEKTAAEIMDLLAKLHKIDPELWQKRVIWCQNLVDNISGVYDKRGRQIAKPSILEQKSPILEQEFPTPENDPEKCAKPVHNLAKTVHNSPKEPVLAESKNSAKLDDNLDSAPEKRISGTEKPILATDIPQRRGEGRGGDVVIKTVCGIDPPIIPPVSLSVNQKDIDEIKKLCVDNLEDGRKVTNAKIEKAIVEFTTPWIRTAIKQAVISNNRRWAYVTGIMCNSKDEGHAPDQSAPVPSCSGCTRYHPSKNGSKERCAFGKPCEKCADYHKSETVGRRKK